MTRDVDHALLQRAVGGDPTLHDLETLEEGARRPPRRPGREAPRPRDREPGRTPCPPRPPGLRPSGRVTRRGGGRRLRTAAEARGLAPTGDQPRRDARPCWSRTSRGASSRRTGRRGVFSSAQMPASPPGLRKGARHVAATGVPAEALRQRRIGRAVVPRVAGLLGRAGAFRCACRSRRSSRADTGSRRAGLLRGGLRPTRSARSRVARLTAARDGHGRRHRIRLPQSPGGTPSMKRTLSISQSSSSLSIPGNPRRHSLSPFACTISTRGSRRARRSGAVLAVPRDCPTVSGNEHLAVRQVRVVGGSRSLHIRPRSRLQRVSSLRRSPSAEGSSIAEMGSSGPTSLRRITFR